MSCVPNAAPATGVPPGTVAVDSRLAQAHNRVMKYVAAGALIPAVATWFIFTDEVAFAVSSGILLLLILLGPADQPR